MNKNKIDKALSNSIIELQNKLEQLITLGKISKAESCNEDIQILRHLKVLNSRK